MRISPLAGDEARLRQPTRLATLPALHEAPRLAMADVQLLGDLIGRGRAIRIEHRPGRAALAFIERLSGSPLAPSDSRRLGMTAGA